MSISRRILNFLIALDQLAWSILTLGAAYPDETISSAAWRYEQEGVWVAILARPVIDFLFLPFEKNHCYESYLAEVNGDHIFEIRGR